MATLPNPLPRLASLGLDLPPGTLVHAADADAWPEPLFWLADDHAVPGTWSALRHAPRKVGLLPVLLETDGVREGAHGPQGWGLDPEAMSYPGDHDPEDVLTDYWDEVASDDEGDWPGLTEPATLSEDDPDSVAADLADSLLKEGDPLKAPRLALVPARRSADIPTAIGWTGPMEHERDTARLSAVLRSWEDRFGIRVVALGYGDLLVSVTSPPTTQAEAEALAAEHYAFCPDNFWQSSTPTIQEYAERRLLNQPDWYFWWD
jgi:hypothetical protein